MHAHMHARALLEHIFVYKSKPPFFEKDCEANYCLQRFSLLWKNSDKSFKFNRLPGACLDAVGFTVENQWSRTVCVSRIVISLFSHIEGWAQDYGNSNIFLKPLFRGNLDPFVNNANLGAIARTSNGT